MVDLKQELRHRLEKRGVDTDLIPGFIRSLANSFACDAHPDLAQINERLDYMGWDGYELDYHTFELARTCFDNEGLTRSGYITSSWLEQNFMDAPT